jgi:hypothetical protein
MRRLLLATVLICAFIVLAAYCNANVTYHLDTQRESGVTANYDAYVGRNVTISSEVVSTGAQSFELYGTLDTYKVFSSEGSAAGRPNHSRWDARARTLATDSGAVCVTTDARRAR